jgi:hypothetical protein
MEPKAAGMATTSFPAPLPPSLYGSSVGDPDPDLFGWIRIRMSGTGSGSWANDPLLTFLVCVKAINT